MLKEFKAFAVSGNLVDVAIAFVMGGAFGKITSSFIDGMVMFMIIKAIAAAKKAAEKEAEAAPAPAPPAQEVLLTEIRDLLKSGR